MVSAVSRSSLFEVRLRTLGRWIGAWPIWLHRIGLDRVFGRHYSAPQRIHTDLGRSLGLALVLAFAAVGCRTGSPTPPATPESTESAAPTSRPDGSLAADWARLGEASRLVGTLGPHVWDGWGEERPPFLLRVGDIDYLVGHPSPPAGFEPVPGVDVAGSRVVRSAGHLAQGIGVQLLGDRLGVALLPRDELQAFLDEILGTGVVALDDVQYVRWVVHEAFHVHQFEKLEMDLPRFGFEGDEMEEVARLEKIDGFASRLDEEARLLRAALGATDDEDLRVKVGTFLAERAARRGTARSDVAGFEQAIEWSEGLARYTDVHVLLAAGRGYQPSAGFTALGARYADPDETWRVAIAWLDDLSSVPGTMRDRYYELGAAEAYLLDRLMPGWQARAFPGAESLESLLAAGLAAADRGVPPALRSLRLAGLRLDSRDYRVAIADAPDEWRRGLSGVADLGPIDGLLFAFPEPVDAAFSMRGAIIPLDIAFFADDGRCLSVQSMTVCEEATCPTYRAPAPFRWALEAPAGALTGLAEGALMELARQ